MSIRLRLTLLYSAIVALTVIAFSVALYVAQSESTLDPIRGELGQQADRFANAPRRPDNRGGDFPPPGNTLPGRWTQLRSADGTITAHTADLISTTLPLSDAGLRAVQSGSTWSETALRGSAISLWRILVLTAASPTQAFSCGKTSSPLMGNPAIAPSAADTIAR